MKFWKLFFSGPAAEPRPGLQKLTSPLFPSVLPTKCKFLNARKSVWNEQKVLWSRCRYFWFVSSSRLWVKWLLICRQVKKKESVKDDRFLDSWEVTA
jgi:hypothetical protein